MVQTLECPLDVEDADMSKVILHKLQKEDFIAIINCLCMKPVSKSRLNIATYCMPALPLMHPILQVNVQKLENKFVCGYHEGDQVLYFSFYDNHNHTLEVTNAIKDS